MSTDSVGPSAEKARGPVVEISAMIDASYPADLDQEARRWRRCAKVSEECGEVTEALLGLAGENPRKGVTHTLHDVRAELLDVALAALGAVAHLGGNKDQDPVEALMEHAERVADRLSRALAQRPGNPHLPEAPEDGRHIFKGGYRCVRCGVYNRPDSPPFHDPCEGEWTQSGKMRAAAVDRWASDLRHPYSPGSLASGGDPS